jgi:hypothetical protein
MEDAGCTNIELKKDGNGAWRDRKSGQRLNRWSTHGGRRSAEGAHSYAEGVRRGGMWVSDRVADADQSRLDSILSEAAINIRDRRSAWQKAGGNRSIPPVAGPQALAPE